jgi:hypothetical protein
MFLNYFFFLFCIIYFIKKMMTDNIEMNLKWCYKDNPNVSFRIKITGHSEYVMLHILKIYYDSIKSFAVVDNR